MARRDIHQKATHLTGRRFRFMSRILVQRSDQVTKNSSRV